VRERRGRAPARARASDAHEGRERCSMRGRRVQRSEQALCIPARALSATAKKPVPVAAFDDADDKKPATPAAPAPAAAADDVDPLDAFMMVNQQKGAEADAKKAAAPKPTLDRLDEDDDPHADYYVALEKKKAEAALQAGASRSGADAAAEAAFADEDADSDDEVYGTARALRDAEKAANVIPSLKTAIEELSGVDHSKIEYNAFEKCFYEEDPEVFAMTDLEVVQLRRELDLRVQGEDPPRSLD
jgi:ATP-dependent RNA helicase DDX46/PRP5